MSIHAHLYRNTLLRALFFVFLCSSIALAQDINFRVMTYNGLKLDGTDTDRQAAFQTVLEASNPDILLMQEIVDAAGADLILNSLNAGGVQYARANFINGVDTDNMLFYRTSIGSLISQNEIPTTLREISEYVMQIGDNQIRFYSAHLKASSGSTNEQRRLDEVTVLRNYLNDLPAGTEFVIVGDFNMYDSGEPAYQKFIANEADNDGRAEDPLLSEGGVGNWHINPAFAQFHTQSPRTTQFGGGANGGLDDRFDFILTSFGINDNADVELIPGTYTAFGNDGNHFDTSILDGPNSVVSATVAQALHDASDHLPVYADFVSLSSGGTGNNPPVAEANGPYSGSTTGPISFSSSGSFDSDGTISSYSWDFGDGGSSTSANPSYTYSADGSYTASLTVTDNSGATNTDFANVTISTGGGGSGTVVFSEIFYDTPGTDSQEEWVEIYNGTSSTADVSGWTITDNNGSGSTFTIPGGTTIAPSTHITIAVNATGFNALYGFDADVYGSIPALNNTGDALLLRDNTSTLIDAVAWEGGASAGTPNAWGSTSQPSATTGNSIVRTNLSTDTDSFSDWSTLTGNGSPDVQPTNASPIAVANGPYAGDTGVAITFSSAGSSDPDGTIASYLWNFGDGNTSTSANPTHSYASAGSYIATLTVTDDLGATGSANANVTVTDVAGTGIVISEVFYDTPGTDSNEEWIEIYNNTGANADLSGWTISDNNGTGSIYTIPNGTSILDATYLTIAINSAGFNALYSFDADVYGGIPALNNTGDALLLKNDSGQTVDAVAWEGGASAGTPTGWGSTTAPTSGTGSTIVRSDVTVDSNTFSDWVSATGNGNPQTQPSPNQDPVAVVNGPYTGVEGTAVSFSSVGSNDPDGTIASYSWDFGDGGSSTSANPSYTYTSAGTYTVNLTVTDNAGATNAAQTTATIDAIVSGGVVISEVFYDTPGNDSNEEWIELFNAGSTTVSIGGWTITDDNGSGSSYTYSNNASLAPGTFYTVAAQRKGFRRLYGKNADKYSSLPALNNNGDAIVLKDDSGNEIDAVAWEGGSGSGLPIAWGSTTDPSAPSGSTIIRADLYGDTDTFTDWSIASGNGNPNTQADGPLSKAIAFDDIEEPEEIPSTISLLQNYPNPFNPSTNIDFELNEDTQVRISVYNLLGQEVATLIDGFKSAGRHTVQFEASNLSTGIYIYRMEAAGNVFTKKMLLTK